MSAVLSLVAARLVRAARRRARPASPAELARRLDPKFRVTPTIRLLSDVAVRWVQEPDQRDIVNTPPRTGKSELFAIWTPVWALMDDPDLKIVVVSHGDDLAQTHSRKVRAIIREHGDFLGFTIAADKTAVGRWNVQGRSGGVLAAGISSGITGHGADLMIIDDVIKDASEADSAAHRKRILNEYRSTLATRIHPGGSCLVLMTRWHEEDLAGALLAQEPDRWRHTNIPAVSEPGIPDALARPAGVAMISALGYTPAHFTAMRRTSGERAWYAMYMGVPSTPEGGLVKQKWLDDNRIAVAPTAPVFTVVAVDPSDSGKGDSCGLVATSLTGGGVVALIADKSAPMTSDQWAREAVKLAIDVGASEIAVEGFAARETYTRVVKEAIKRAAVRHLTTTGTNMRRIAVSSWPPKGRPRVGDAVARSSALLQALEVGRCVLAGHFPDLETKAVAWQAGQHQPDSLAALVIGHDVCVHSAGLEWDISAPLLDGALGPTARTAGSAGSVVDLTDWMSRKIS
ncbi:gp2 protein [Mycobacteroides abscessus subsp. abscessus]|uniref:terminase large subunit domain-containing protein n=1 Tax=Mycobacteroides abscessus TaxID=36809 RepID=UPI00092BC5C5|nr:terminase family protein [Mycobacteroides abscessus]SIE56851.1 gp2 protein [Mycobacteroides abscessus subsp. abscessus]SKV26051.1 gp2 protein [Mycobacteroides abscessus subsp. abscessus]